MDAHYWNPGWVKTPRLEWTARQERLLEPERWIADGTYGSTLELRLAAADTVVLDFPRWLCTGRVLKRVFVYRRGTRPDMAAGCDERVDWDFVKYVWTFPKKYRPITEEKFRGLEGKPPPPHPRRGRAVLGPSRRQTFLGVALSTVQPAPSTE